ARRRLVGERKTKLTRIITLHQIAIRVTKGILAELRHLSPLALRELTNQRDLKGGRLQRPRRGW
ncbi:hypothetical protein D1716_24310, partial [Salmonella enterica]|nr:hypothetical protein [Salmonella enterica]